MKKVFSKLIIIVTFWVLLFAACDKVDAPYVIPAVVDTSFHCTTPEFPTLTSHYKRILLEDYTGHTCVNCPGAAVIAKDLKTQYGDTLVVLAVHGGYFAEPKSAPFEYDFRTDASQAWDGFFKVSNAGNPKGLVNRKYFPTNKHILSPSSWANEISVAVKETPIVELQMILDYNSTLDNLCIHTKTSFLDNLAGKSLNICIVVIEDKIVQTQSNNNPSVGSVPEISDYEHNHVVRTAINGIWGTPVLQNNATNFEPVINTFPIHVKTSNSLYNNEFPVKKENQVVPSNCHIVAFVYDTDTKEILQVVEKKVIE